MVETTALEGILQIAAVGIGSGALTGGASIWVLKSEFRNFKENFQAFKSEARDRFLRTDNRIDELGKSTGTRIDDLSRSVVNIQIENAKRN